MDDAPTATLPAFDTARIAIVTRSDTVPLTVELAKTEAQRALGLMERAELAPDHGMLFLYPEAQPEDTGFWMFRTRIPLDVAFLDRDGRILSIVPMEPCTSPYSRWCDTYPAGQPFAAGLEVARDFFASRGIGVGDRVLIPPTAAEGVR